ncbi:MAG TPA: hypothetical protein VNC78_02040 [Actinomycetota bacterium]|nr:hypothetical protein [Actinomycetota bacterium]
MEARTCKRLLPTLAAVAALFLLVACGPLVRDASLSESIPPHAEKADDVVSRPAPRHRIASFAMRAVADVGLLNPDGALYVYRGFETEGPEWVVQFSASRCFDTPTRETCRRLERALLTIVEDGRDLRVIEIKGPMSAQQQRSLRAYRERTRPIDKPGFEMPAPVVSYPRPEWPHSSEYFKVEAVPLWIGPLSSAPASHTCTVTVFDEDGDQIGTKKSSQVRAATKEGERSNAIVGLAFKRGDVPAVSAKASCEKTPLP